MYTFSIESMLSKRYLYITNHCPLKKLETRKLEESNMMGGRPDYESSNDNKGLLYCVVHPYFTK